MSTSWEEHEAQADQDRDHPVGAFRGIAFGLLCSLPFWAFAIYMWALTR